ncbi:hypothetical protein Ddye_023068 [Dipteronia dyeriana]|uniref:Uncharacterized protein n=1 Tax=Dipteronia dyeriana TaxID=168575 RepID=A0AAD9TT85_9ROSI|nr:hypothetical protein Ddye_023068 [Dipteronia dyeriana]
MEELTLDWKCIVKENLHGKFSDYSCKLKSLMFVNYCMGTTICPCHFLYTLPSLEKLEVYNGCFKEIFFCGQIDCKEKQTPSKLSYLKLYKVFDRSFSPKNIREYSKVLQNLATLELLVSQVTKLSVFIGVFPKFDNFGSIKVSWNA